MAGPKKGKRSVIMRIMVGLNILVVLALLMSYASLYIDPRTWWVPAFFGLSYPLILLFNLIFIIIWLVAWKKYILLSLVPVLAGYSLLLSIYPLRISTPTEKTKETLKVTTYNIHGFSYDPGNSKMTKKKVREFIRQNEPGVLCFQEFAIRNDSLPSMKNVVSDLGFEHYIFYNYFNPGKRKIINGLMIASDFPIISTGSIRDVRKKIFTIYTDILWQDDTLRIYNVHLASIHFAQTEYTFYETLKDPDVDNENLKEGIFKILRKLRDAFLFRAEQTELLKRHLNDCPYPVVICGDFNDTPFSFTYRNMTAKLTDSFKTAGNELFGTTYAGRLPSYRIDYILYDGHLSVSDYTKNPLKYSDHFPVTVTLSPMKQGRGF